MAIESDDAPRRGWDTRRPWRTPRLPELVGITGAAEIIGVHVTGISRWLKPGSGAKSAWGGFGEQRTYMIPPARVDGNGAPVWVREDVVRFAAELGRQRRAPRPRAKT